MPCESHYPDAREERNERAAESARAWVRAELDLTTRLLCGVLRRAENEGTMIADPELAAWWERHKALDAREGRA